MQQINPRIRSMSWDETTEYGLCNRGLMMEDNEITYRLSSGSADSLYVFKSGVVLYVLTVNLNLDYLALDVYMPNEPDPIDSIFLQGEWSIEEFLGKRWRTLSVKSITSCLINHLS